MKLLTIEETAEVNAGALPLLALAGGFLKGVGAAGGFLGGVATTAWVGSLLYKAP